MKEKLINVVILRNNQGKEIVCSIDTIKDDLETFYNIIGCSCIDIQVRYIKGKPYNIIMDDEFLLKSVPVPTLYEKGKREYLCGNLILCPINEEDECELGSFKNYVDQYQLYEDIKSEKGRYTFSESYPD